jgi:signal transduction histidine kinase
MENESNLNIYLLLIVGTEAMLLIAAGIILFVIAYQKRLLKQQEEKNEMELQHQLQLHENYIRVTESERKRIAADLHDEVGHALLTLRLQLYAWPEGAGGRQTIDNTLETIRRIAYDLYPPGLDLFGLPHTLRELLKTAETNNVALITDIDDDTSRIGPDVQLAVFRIVQELLSNTLRYAAAGQVMFSLKTAPEQLSIGYSDNGKGTDLDTARKGMGMRNIRNRLLAFGGEIQIHSSPGNGFRFDATIPLKK